jgi:hypothetical protein
LGTDDLHARKHVMHNILTQRTLTVNKRSNKSILSRAKNDPHKKWHIVKATMSADIGSVQRHPVIQ